MVARRSGQPAKRTPSAVVAARRLSLAQFRGELQFTDVQVAMLDRIAAGRAPRNAASILRAMELKATYAYQKPKIELEFSEKPRSELLAEAQARIEAARRNGAAA